MGQQDINDSGKSADEVRLFMRHLLRDIQALEHMLEHDMFETNRSRIGAEQEYFLVNQNMRPAAIGDKVLEQLDQKYFTPELALFNLEANFDPQEFDAGSLARIESQLNTLTAQLRDKAAGFGAHVLQTGILPTIRQSDLNLGNITPKPRYRMLNDVLCGLRGEDYRLDINGQDELRFTHDNVLIEACNTSFQLHFQVDPDEFPLYYNIAQLVSGPLLALAANSPVLMGKRLWHETRIALFQQAIDTRSSNKSNREMEPRVWFGNSWVKKSVLELYQEDIARFRVLFAQKIDEDPFEAIDRGDIPKLQALCLHNGTVYRWNRPCYGISDGKPHLRIENRILPAGPTALDTMANSAFYLGLLCGYAEEVGDVTTHMDFNDAKLNFHNAAMRSMESQMHWFKDKKYRFDDLMLEELIPLAKLGLQKRGIDSVDVDRYMDVVTERVHKHQNGATWIIKNYNFILDQGFKSDNACALLTSSMINRQASGQPVHSWNDISCPEISALKQTNQIVEQVMSTDIFTVQPDDLIDLAAKIMHWNHIRHVAVEDASGKLIGIVSYRRILEIYGKYAARGDVHLVPVEEVMLKDPITISPGATIEEAIALMRKHKVGCLPVMSDAGLTGMLTEAELMDEFSKWLEKKSS
jgi:CBS domain-containing protein